MHELDVRLFLVWHGIRTFVVVNALT